MAGTGHPSCTPLGMSRYRPLAAQGSFTRALALGLVLVVGLALGACAVQWGDSGDDPGDSSGNTPRDRNQLYLKEQQRMDQQRQLDRGGPSDR